MSRTPARVTQADVARCVRAALGAQGVEIRRDGSIFISLVPAPEGEKPDSQVEPVADIVL